MSTFQGRRVLVTGGAGFIGSELTAQLVAQGARVTIIDNLVNGKRENVADLPLDQCELVVEDIRNRDAVRRLVGGIDVVFHLACLGVRHSIHSPLENHEVNATATLDLLKAAREAGPERLVYVSSSEVYGTAQWAPMTEDHPTMPMTVYGASKLAGECYARAFHRTYGFPTVVVRPFNSYGPRCHHEGDSGEVIPKFLLRTLAGRPMVIFGDGSQTRDFTCVSDTARGILAAGLSDSAVGETINLGQGKETRIDELAGLVWEAAGLSRSESGPAIEHVEARPGDVLRLFADSGKAASLLDFHPRIALNEGLALLRDWYLAKGVPLEKLLDEERVRNWETAA